MDKMTSNGKKEIKISIIMPAYNSGAYIKESILCVMNQTHQNWELLIVDDFSSDNTIDVIEEFDDKRIVLFKNTSNNGAAYSRNLGISKATGQYIAFLDADDLWDATKLEKQLNFMRTNNYSFSYTNYRVINANGTLTGVFVTGPQKITHKMFVRSDYIGCLTAMYKKDAYEDLQIPSNIYKRNDYALWLKVSERTNCFLLNEILSSYRKTNSGISSTKKTALVKHHVHLFQSLYGFGKIKSTYLAYINVLFYFVRKLKYRKKIL